MITQICCLRFVDGQTITAQIKATSKTEDASVFYSGPVERLPLNSERANAIELKAYFQSFARELHAEFAQEENDDLFVGRQQLDEL